MSAYKKNYSRINWSVMAKRSVQIGNGRGIFFTPAPGSKQSTLTSPRIVSDYAPYECPVTGKIIEGRAAHEENLKRTNCRLLEPGEKEDNIKRHAREVAAEDKRRDAAIDGIVDKVAVEYF